MTRSYSELCEIHGFRERYAYLRVYSQVGIDTFGFDRWLNQAFYTSAQWRQVRQEVIVRDRGCDLGVEDYPVLGKIVIHHMNPLAANDVSSGDDAILDPEFLITTSHRTHNAIHYGDEKLLARPLVKRRPGDTKLW